MSHISKCPKVTDVLSYWEASGEISEPSYKSLLYFSSIGSYCRMFHYNFLLPSEAVGFRESKLYWELFAGEVQNPPA